MINRLKFFKFNPIISIINAIYGLTFHMAFYDHLLNRLFPKDKEVSIHEVLKRSPKFSRSYDQWKSSGMCDKERNAIFKSYHFKLSNLKTSVDIEIYHSPYANGLIIYPHADKEPVSFEFLMEYIREILEKDGYRLVHADRKMMERGKQVTSLEKYYLKPPLSAMTPTDQIFGNVVLELSFVNYVPSKFKMMANIYSDRLYNEPRAFEDLIALLFDQATTK